MSFHHTLASLAKRNIPVLFLTLRNAFYSRDFTPLFRLSKSNLKSIFRIFYTVIHSKFFMNTTIHSLLIDFQSLLNQQDCNTFIPKSNQSIEYSLEEAPFHIFKIESNSNLKNIVFLSLYCPTSSISQAQQNLAEFYIENNFYVFVIITSGIYPFIDVDKLANCHAIVSRENLGFDFASWSLGLNLISDFNRFDSITFTNDSIFPVLQDSFDFKAFFDKLFFSSSDIIYGALSEQVLLHGQSFFIHITRNGLNKGIQKFFSIKIPQLVDKQSIINLFELPMYRFFDTNQYSVSSVFKPHVFSTSNHSLSRPLSLISSGFPFYKITHVLDKATRYSLLKNEYLDVSTADMLSDHLNSRKTTSFSVKYHHKQNIYDENKVFYPAWVDVEPITIQESNTSWLPLTENKQHGSDPMAPEFICVYHVFYPQLLSLGLDYLSRLGKTLHLYITTDSNSKKADILDILSHYNFKYFVYVYPNRGRNVLPLLHVLKSIHNDYSPSIPVLHLHTKKSPHEKALALWGDFLLNQLIGDPFLVNITLDLMQNGYSLIFPAQPDSIRNRINWGFDFPTALSISRICGFSLSEDDLLDFPPGVMFWFSLESFQILYNNLYKFEHLFETEAAQEDGTAAHSIERLFVYLLQNSGFKRYLKLNNISS